jgi:hypothetical protein
LMFAPGIADFGKRIRPPGLSVTDLRLCRNHSESSSRLQSHEKASNP